MKGKSKSPPKSSWRDIQQSNRQGNASKVTRKRRLMLVFRISMACLLLVAIGTGILGLVYFFEKSSDKAAVRPGFSNELVFKSNGVLSEDWFQERYGELLRTDVREIEVSNLKRQLEQHGQVETAAVAVRLPSSLTVFLTEREPILRVRLRGTDGRPVVLLLARDGTLYEGDGYPAETLRRLPGVAGLRLQKTAGSYAPVSGLESVSRLLDHTKETLPSVYRHWKVVDLGDWDPEQTYKPSLVRIRSAHIEEIVFSTDAIEEQVQRLAGILQHTQRYQMGQPKFIDLSFGQEAVIRYN